MKTAEKPPINWAKVLQGDLKRFALSLSAGHSVAEARRISRTPPPMHYDGQAQQKGAR
jgi:hypothetical protein